MTSMTADAGNKGYSAYLLIERMVVLQELEPGSLVSEAELMRMIGYGRTPVREAVQRLARERMVKIFRNRGVLVAGISIPEELKLLEIRLVLEVLAVRLAAQRANVDHRSKIRHLVDDLSQAHLGVERYVELVRETHELISVMSDNEYLRDALTPLQGLSRRFWLAFIIDAKDDIDKWSMLTRRILSGVLSEDPDAAGEASRALNARLVEFTRTAVERRPRNFFRERMSAASAQPGL